VTVFEVLLAVAIILMAAVQAVVLILLYRAIMPLVQKTERIMNVVEPEIRDVAAGIRGVRMAAEVSAKDISEMIATVRSTTDELAETVRIDSREISGLVHRAVGVAERQIDSADQAIDAARDRVNDIGWRLDRTILEPARIVLALGMGLRKGIEAVFSGHGRGRKPDPDADGRHS